MRFYYLNTENISFIYIQINQVDSLKIKKKKNVHFDRFDICGRS